MKRTHNGINIAATIIFEELAAGASFQRVMGMIDLAARLGAINETERQGLIEYLKKRG